jgi:hypothetical protein
MSHSLDFLSPEKDQNYPKASIAIIAIKRFSLLYNLDIKQIDLNLTYIQKKNYFMHYFTNEITFFFLLKRLKKLKRKI